MKKKYPGLTRLIKKEVVPPKRRHYPEAISRPTGANEIRGSKQEPLIS